MYKRQRYKKALKYIDEHAGPEEEPSLSLLLYRGYAWWGLGETGKSRAVFERARKKFPDSPEVLSALGALELADGDLEEARALFNKAVWTNKNYWGAYLGRCAVEYLQEDYSTAYDDCRRAKAAAGPVPVSYTHLTLPTKA